MTLATTSEFKNKAALRVLADAIKAGKAELKRGYPLRLFMEAFGTGEAFALAARAYGGCLTSAVGLHDFCLHERVVAQIKYSKRYGAHVTLFDLAKPLFVSELDLPSRALLLAVTEVLEAQA